MLVSMSQAAPQACRVLHRHPLALSPIIKAFCRRIPCEMINDTIYVGYYTTLSFAVSCFLTRCYGLIISYSISVQIQLYFCLRGERVRKTAGLQTSGNLHG